MLTTIHDLLDSSPHLLLFTVIGLGYFLGQVNLWGFHLNVAAVLFVGLVFGAWDAKAFQLPEELYFLGLVLFVYSIGLQSGPSFFAVFRERGLKVNALALIGLAGGGLAALLMKYLLGIPSGILAGLFAGSLTNTPSLAAATESMRSVLAAGGIQGQQAADLLATPTQGYSLAYPFGVIGAMLAMQVMSRVFHVSFERERENYRQRMAARQSMKRVEFKVANEGVFGKTIREARIGSMTGIVLSRIRHGAEYRLVTGQTRMEKDDVVAGLGDPEAIARAEMLIGPVVDEGVFQNSPGIEHRDFVVTNKILVGRLVWDINVDPALEMVISRVRRGYTALPIDHSTTIEYGDQVRAVTYHENMEKVENLFGDPIRDMSETDFLSISLGLCLGILLGMVPIPLPNGSVLRLGFAGGPMIVALFLGWLGRTGPIIWTMPNNANLTLRQMGLHLFMAGIGIKAGGGILEVFQNQGIQLFLAGAVITLTTSLTTLIVGYRLFKLEMIELLGVNAGVHTQPAALAMAGQLAGNEAPNLTYAAVQPFSMIVKIIMAQLFILML